MSSIATLDIVFCSTTLLIVVVATYRGVIKEFFSLLNWTVSFILSYLLAPLLSKVFANMVESKLVLNVSLRIIIFMISFLIFMLLTSKFVEDLTFSINTYLNKILGMIYGVFKSILIFGLIFSLYNCFFDYALGQKLINKNANKMPKWYLDSYSSSIISFSGDLIDPIVKGFIGFLKFNYSDVIKIDKKIQTKYQYDKIDDLENSDNLPQNQNNSSNQNISQKNIEPQNKTINIKNNDDNGYDKQDIQKLQKLIEIIN
jgi:uncharacterized membrane protein required for colicin V production